MFSRTPDTALAPPRLVETVTQADTVPGHVGIDQLIEIGGFVNALKTAVDDRLRLRPGHRVLDAGCGPAVDTLRLASAVGLTGLVVGVDIDQQMLAFAKRRTSASAGSMRATYAAADAVGLPFASDVFDACRCERVLQHVEHPRLAVRETVRVVRPGGRVVLADSDWGSLSLHADEVPLERRIVHAVANSFRSGYVGRQLRELCADAGLVDLDVSVWPVQWTSLATFRATSFMSAGIDRRIIEAGTISRDEWARFESNLERIDARRGFFATASIVIVAGTKSASTPAREGSLTFQFVQSVRGSSCASVS